ncbi:MAG: carbon-nitrogen hydrolase family protein [Alphaproteobacteria bacterium]|nr:carbon-nitrogen hydrolase family protein [Alphaproteobacteria bacterium]MDX5369506.1 carbon-nitrogen hydrolase family protein [Alphaproteobacteria bacterium]MDX5464164.1 carbon-nitrogen hydrolase family protein [Alphaproteobacteria bacterium]
MSGTVRAACLQMTSGDDLDANIAEAADLARQAVEQGATFLALPENAGFLESRTERLAGLLKPDEETPIFAAMSALAREHGVAVLVGSTGVKLADDARAANRSVLFGPDGARLATYDKIHMFDVDLPGGESYRESARYRPGGQAVVADLAWGRLGLSICYDLRFPHLYRMLAHAGAQVLTIPSAFTVPTGEAHWHVLLRARAIETGCFVVAPAQTGTHPNGRRTYGHSLIVAPWGDVLADAGTEPGVIVADLDLARVAEARTRVPALTHDRVIAAPKD